MPKPCDSFNLFGKNGIVWKINQYSMEKPFRFYAINNISNCFGFILPLLHRGITGWFVPIANSMHVRMKHIFRFIIRKIGEQFGSIINDDMYNALCSFQVSMDLATTNRLFGCHLFTMLLASVCCFLSSMYDDIFLCILSVLRGVRFRHKAMHRWFECIRRFRWP